MWDWWVVYDGSWMFMIVNWILYGGFNGFNRMQENKVVPFENCCGVTLASLASMRAASHRGCHCYGPGNVDRWVGQPLS